jgi:beta-lactamase class A
MIADAHGKAVTNPLGTVIVYTLRDSDNTASDALLRFLGGPRGVKSYLDFLGVRDIDVSRTEKEIAADIKSEGREAYWKDERDSATPNAMLLLFRMYDQKAHGLDDAGQRFVQDMLLNSEGGRRRIRAGVPADDVVLDKSGTMPGVVNDAGIVATPDNKHRIILVVFTKAWKKTPDAKREKLIADISRAIVSDFTK